jgi:hypothetical protein
LKKPKKQKKIHKTANIPNIPIDGPIIKGICNQIVINGTITAMTLAETKPKPTIGQVGPIVDVGPIPFSNTPTTAALGNIATTTNKNETLPAELALIKPSSDAAGVVLGLKLKMSPRDHAEPRKLTIPLVVLPEGASLFDKRNARWTTVEVDLDFVYDRDGDPERGLAL